MTRVDRLRKDGWEECDERIDIHPDVCECGGLGLVPPDGMVEAAAKAIHDNDRGTRPTKDERWDQLGEIQEFYHLLARAALVAAARWEAPK